jgi:hypothetical protein
MSLFAQESGWSSSGLSWTFSGYNGVCLVTYLLTVGNVLSDAAKILASVAVQLMKGDLVVLEDQKIPVRRVGRGRLRMASFRVNGRVLEAIEQNPEKAGQWGKLARDGHQVVQFRDVDMHKYVAVAVDGAVREYRS